jgi:hypothetical protein
MAPHHFTHKTSGVRMGVHSKKELKKAFKAGDVGTYSKATTANRCRKYDAMCNGTGPPKFAKGEKDLIRAMVEDSRNAHMDVGLWNWFESDQPPVAEE